MEICHTIRYFQLLKTYHYLLKKKESVSCLYQIFNYICFSQN